MLRITASTHRVGEMAQRFKKKYSWAALLEGPGFNFLFQGLWHPHIDIYAHIIKIN